MESAGTPRGQISLADCTVVDMDSHVGERLHEELLPYIENRAIDKRIRQTNNLDEAVRKIYSNTRVTPEFAQTKAASEAEEGRWGEGLAHKEARKPETKIDYMNEYGVDHSVLTPGINLGLASVNHDQTAVEISRAYNRWMADTFYNASDRLSSAILVAHQRPDLAAEVIDEWADEDDAVAVQLPASGLVPPAGHRWFDPIYEAAEDNDLPVLMHTGNSSTNTVFPVQREWSETFIEDHFFTFPVEGIWHLTSMMFQGVFERFPDLNVVMQETGVEWLPWLMWRMDDHYLQNSQDVPILERTPSEYIRESCYLSTQPLGHTDTPRHLSKILEIAGGAETVVFATDHPHPDFDTPEEMFQLLNTNANFSPNDVRAMLGDTAVELFDL